MVPKKLLATCGGALGILAACAGSDGAGSTALETGGAAGTDAGSSASGPGGVSAMGGVSAVSGATNSASGNAGTASSAGAFGGGGAGGAPLGGSMPVGGSGGANGQAGSGGIAGQGGGSGGSSAGASGYAPCPSDGSACLILPFGDSITDGVGSTDLAGYRPLLFKLIVQANQKASFVGSRSGGPEQVAGKPFPKNHEGHPGWTIDSGYVSFGEGISTLVPQPAFKTVPHIVLLMIGTNDVSANKGTDMIAARLDTLLDKVVQAAPKALVVVAQLTPIGWSPAAASNYNGKIPGLVQARVGKGQHLVVVDMSKMPVANLNNDSLHPNDTGYAFMANTWYAAIKDHLPQ